jgi:flagellar hook-length control protein FliK
VSNALRHVGSNRGVDAAIRAVPSLLGDAPAGDGEFATVMNLARGPAPGGDAADPATVAGDGTQSAANAAPAKTGPSEGAPTTTLGPVASDTAIDIDPAQQPGDRPAHGAGDHAAPIVGAIAGPRPPATKPVRRSDDLAAPPRHRDRQTPQASANDAIPLVAAPVAPAVSGRSSGTIGSADPSEARSNPSHGIAMPAAPGALVGATSAPSAKPAPWIGPPRFTGAAKIADGPPSAAIGATARAAGNRFDTNAAGALPVTVAAPSGDASGDATEEFSFIPPANRGRTGAGDANVAIAPPAVAAIRRNDGPADQVAGQQSGADRPGPSLPDPGNSPAPAPANVAGTDAPVRNPPPATIQPAIAGIVAEGASAPVLPAPRTRQAGDASAVIGASSAAIGLTPPTPPSASAGTAPADGGSPGGAPSFGEALANHVLSMAAGGHQETTLQLQPPQLGELTVRVAVQGRDVSAWFGAAQPQVQQAVSQALDQLRLDLAGAGFNLAGAWVGADTSGTPRQSGAASVPARRAGFAAPGIDRTNDGADPARRSSGVSVYV